MRMKKKFWIAILTAVLLLTLLPTAAFAAEDSTTQETIYRMCKFCNKNTDHIILGYSPNGSGSQHNEVHYIIRECIECHRQSTVVDSEAEYNQHTGGDETPTCTTGKTCEKCGAQYGILGHAWGEWQPNGDGTHFRTCRRDGCGAVDTANCSGDGSATCVTPGTCTACGGQYYSGHTFPARWKWDSDTEVGRDAESHWVWCLNCTEGKTHYGAHSFRQGTWPACLKSPATCVSKAVYYENCGACYYKGTETYLDPNNGINPKNHTGNEEIRDAVAATCTQDGYTGDTYCKDCGVELATGTVIPAAGKHTGNTEIRGAAAATCTTAGYTGNTYCKDCDTKLASGKAIPATGQHTGGTATCLWAATCEFCHEEYGGLAGRNHVNGCVLRWKITETEHEHSYSRCGRVVQAKEAHTFGDWVALREATAEEPGEREHVCEVCGYTGNEVIPVVEIKEDPAPAPTAAPEPAPTAEPAAEPAEPEPAPARSSAWWIIPLVIVAGAAGVVIARRKKKK